jgi:hypothetical protein
MPPPAHLAGWLFQACRYVLAETRCNDKRFIAAARTSPAM